MELQFRKDFFVQLTLVASVLLLLEWLWPLNDLEIISNTALFVGFIVMLAFLKLFIRIPFVLRFFIGTIYILWTIKFIYFRESLNFFKDLMNQLRDDFFLILGLEISDISFVLQTILLFLLLWLIVDAIIESLIETDRFILLLIATSIFVASMDTFTYYDGKWSIFRIVMIGFSILGLRTFFHNIRFTKVSFKNGFERKWLVMVFSFLLVSTGLGYAIPKIGPVLPDPLPFITKLVDEVTSSENQLTMPDGYIKEIGLGEDDSILGGPLLGNKEVVFSAVSSTRALGYFRVESKDYYSGRGWETVNKEVAPSIGTLVQQKEQLDPSTIEFYEEESLTRMNETMNYVPYQSFSSSVFYSEDFSFDFTDTTTYFNRIVNNQPAERPAVSNHFYRIKMERGLLRQAPPASLEIRAAYTQLPDTLPQEVRDLAAQITNGISNDFDKVVAIESYLKSGIFTYDMVNVPYASEEVDYVYQFLFETRRGYCVNFSTAMTVMLRALDIPAIWVKGYTAGSIVDTTSQGQYIYSITNDNAHAWVEVYFEGVGWIPFDPTMGFSTNIEFVNQIYTREELLNNPNPIEQPEENTPNLGLEEAINNATTPAAKEKERDIKVILLVILGFILAQLFILIKYRLKWLPYYYIWRMKRYKKADAPDKALKYLFTYLLKMGYEKLPQETLKEFFHRVQGQWKDIDFSRLLDLYTKWLYQNNKGDVWEEILPEWEEILKKMSTFS